MAAEERSSSSNKKKEKKGQLLNKVLFIAVLSVSAVNILYFHYVHLDEHLSSPSQTFRELHVEGAKTTGDHSMVTAALSKLKPGGEDLALNDEEQHSVAGLSCGKYGGPPDDYATEEMVFWSDIPSDAKYRSPFHAKGLENAKYITFEPDHGGWNNIRMAMETALVMAHAMGRTLVLPPEQQMYLLGQDHFSFNDFFHLDSIALEHDGFDIITMEDFLKREGITGGLVNTKTGEVMKPPEDRVQFGGVGRKSQDLKILFQYLRNVGYVPEGWNPTNCFVAIPSSTDPAHADELQRTFDDIVNMKDGRKVPSHEDFIGKPTPVDAPMIERMREMLADRENICIYNAEMQNSKLVHFDVDKTHNARMLTHFYAFIFFQDWRQDLWTKRFIRDHVRYVDEIVCAAARVVRAVRERARKYNPENVDGLFDSMHVRRGDFQYKKTRLSAEELYKKSSNELTDGSTLFIATDERNKSFFKPLAEKYDVCFLDDFKDEIVTMNSNYFGMLDQLVASKGRVFFGTWFSTLSGYINRMRGYYIAKHNLEGHKDGTMDSYYFVPDDRKYMMRDYYAVKKPIYMREFPISWLDIDKGIEDIEQMVSKENGKTAEEAR